MLLNSSGQQRLCSTFGLLAQFLLELRCRSFLLIGLLDSRSFLLERRWGKCFVELAWSTTFLFVVGLARAAQIFFGVTLLSGFPVGLSQF